MRRAKLALVLVILAAQLAALFTFTTPARADTIGVSFDAGGYANYVIEDRANTFGGTNEGELCPTDGAPDGNACSLGVDFWGPGVLITLPSPMHVTNVTADWYIEFGGVGYRIELLDASQSLITYAQYSYGAGWLEWGSGFDEEGVYYVRALIGSSNWQSALWRRIDNILITGTLTPEYNSNPAAGGTIDLGLSPEGVELAGQNALIVSNSGGATLTINSIGFSGDDAAAFSTDTATPFDVAPTMSEQVSVNCTPDADSVTATMTVTSNDADEASNNYTVTCANLNATSGGAWAYPLHFSDRRQNTTQVYQATAAFSPLNNNEYSLDPDRNANIVYSNAPGASVWAIAAGTVDTVVPLPDMCANQPILAPQRAWTCISPDYLPTGEWGGIMGPGYVYLGHENAYLITTILEDDRKILYVVAEPTVTDGDEVSEGCFLGKTLPLYAGLTGDPAAGYVEVSGTEYSGGYTFDLTPYIGVEPAGLNCGRQAYNEHCQLVSNPTFDGGNNWAFEGDEYGEYPEFDTDGVGIIPVGKVRQTLNLDPGQQYAIAVWTHGLLGNYQGSFWVQLGAERTAITAEYQTATQTLIPPAYYTANNGSLYDLVIEGANNATDVVVDFVCVYDPDENPPAPLGGCIFVDPEFDVKALASPWTLSESPAAQIAIPGMASAIKDAYVEQSVSLHPKDGGANQEYTITATYRREGKALEGESAGIAWAFAGFSGTFGASAAQIWQTDSDNFTVTETTTDEFRFTANGSVNNVVQIDRLCITTADGAQAPGYRAPVIVVSCKICTYTPVGDINEDITEYVAWLGCVLARLWECQFKTVLLGIWTVLVDIFTFLGFFRLWIAGVILNLWTAGNGNIQAFAAYLSGEFHNLTMQLLYGLGGSSGGSGGGGANLWDVIVALFNLFRSIIDGIFGLLGALVELFLALIGMLVNIVSNFLANTVGMVLSIIQGMINGVNMTPTELPEWFPDCADTSSPLIGVCGGLRLMEDELQTGPAVYLVPITFGIAIINLLLWGLEKFLSIFKGGDSDD